MKDSIKKPIFRIFDLLSAPFIFLTLPALRAIRRHGVHNFPFNLKNFLSMGVFPIRDHYYEPQLTYSKEFDAEKKRKLHIDFNLGRQIAQLSQLRYSEELSDLALDGKVEEGRFYVNNPAFGPGDSDLYYLLVRNIRPARIIEIGSGFSTLVCLEALKKNKAEGAHTQMTCIEPYELNWLERTEGIQLIRESVEKVSPEVFASLQENDILFVDSSHIIRPENDVLFEYLELLPQLNKGVIIHIHDIFSPRHYRPDWLQQEFRFWNEQYLLEAFLYYNESFEIMYSLNHLKNDAFDETRKILRNVKEKDQPGSFWLRKIR
ncbi:MAG: class I SAM-dependent methyltransferase [Chitinophagaceae bacterium]|nr:class I SAM-dependent methyltransferase [Chitinophagaceae bacterium]